MKKLNKTHCQGILYIKILYNKLTIFLFQILMNVLVIMTVRIFVKTMLVVSFVNAGMVSIYKLIKKHARQIAMIVNVTLPQQLQVAQILVWVVIKKTGQKDVFAQRVQSQAAHLLLVMVNFSAFPLNLY